MNPPLYEGAHLLLYIAAFIGAAFMQSWRALLFYAVVVGGLCALGFSLALEWRETLPGRGGWDALGDAILLSMLIASSIAGLAFQAGRLYATPRWPNVAPWLNVIGFFLAPPLGIGALILFANLLP